MRQNGTGGYRAHELVLVEGGVVVGAELRELPVPVHLGVDLDEAVPVWIEQSVLAGEPGSPDLEGPTPRWPLAEHLWA
ncbi:hypothetical protein K7G98_24665 [Saccharothrix sp. MB29]|nr:hypothetical protein [Saccharothrix sp. MB29]